MALTVADILKLFDEPNLSLLQEFDDDGKPTGDWKWDYFDGKDHTGDYVINTRKEEEHFEETDEVIQFFPDVEPDGEGLDFMSIEDWKIAGDAFLQHHRFMSNNPVETLQATLAKIFEDSLKELLQEIDKAIPGLSDETAALVAAFVQNKEKAARKELNEEWRERERKWEKRKGGTR